MTDNMFFVFSNPAEGQEDAFNQWYDAVHVHEVCAVPGISSAQRYCLAPMEIPENDIGSVPPPAHRYLVVYTTEGAPGEIMASFLARMGSGEMSLSPALDFGSVSMGFWSPLGPRVTSA